MTLNRQELLNATYSGPFVTQAKAVFSNSRNPQLQKWGCYVSGSANRQDILHTALAWVSKGEENIGGYMSLHRNDASIEELKTYFDTVIDWAKTLFGEPKGEMRGSEWGLFYERYHANSYNPDALQRRVDELYADEAVRNKKGVFEYLLGGATDIANCQMLCKTHNRAKGNR